MTWVFSFLMQKVKVFKNVQQKKKKSEMITFHSNVQHSTGVSVCQLLKSKRKNKQILAFKYLIKPLTFFLAFKAFAKSKFQKIYAPEKKPEMILITYCSRQCLALD